MPAFSRSLEAALHRALEYASERHHEYATLEHLLLALLDDRDAAAVMRACNVEPGRAAQALTEYLDSELSTLSVEGLRRGRSPRPASSASFTARWCTCSTPAARR